MTTQPNKKRAGEMPPEMIEDIFRVLKHDLVNILSSIAGFAEIISMNFPGECKKDMDEVGMDLEEVAKRVKNFSHVRERGMIMEFLDSVERNILENMSIFDSIRKKISCAENANSLRMIGSGFSNALEKIMSLKQIFSLPGGNKNTDVCGILGTITRVFQCSGRLFPKHSVRLKGLTIAPEAGKSGVSFDGVSFSIVVYFVLLTGIEGPVPSAGVDKSVEITVMRDREREGLSVTFMNNYFKIDETWAALPERLLEVREIVAEEGGCLSVRGIGDGSEIKLFVPAIAGS